MAPGGSRETEEQMRIRITRDVLSEAGLLSPGRLSVEALFLLPQDFTRAYADLFYRALREEVGTAGGPTDENVVRRTESKHRGKRITGAKSKAGRKYKTYWSVKSEEALKVKEAVDRKLTRIVRDIERGLKEGMLKCVGVGCKRYIERSWRYCPSCGTPTPDERADSGPGNREDVSHLVDEEG